MLMGRMRMEGAVNVEKYVCLSKFSPKMTTQLPLTQALHYKPIKTYLILRVVCAYIMGE